MGSVKNSDSGKSRRSRITTPEARDNHLINLAYDQVELQLRQGTAPAPIVGYLLKLNSEKEKLEREALVKKNLLLEKQVQHLEASVNQQADAKEALEAFRKYAGETEIEFEDDDYYD